MATGYAQFDYPSWITNSRLWNKILLSGVELPGITHLQKTGLKERTANSKANGSDGNSVVLQGLETPEWDITLEIYTGSDEQKWRKLQKTLVSRTNPDNRGQYSIYHPTLAGFGITNCVIHSIFEQAPRSGGPLIVDISFLAISPVKEKNPSALKSIQKTPLELPPTINTDYQKVQGKDLTLINNPAKQKINY